MQQQIQTPNPSSFSFQFNFKTSKFNLSAVLNDTKLNIKLQDYMDWIVYCKEYTEENIGGQIHRKADLEDVYFSLSQAAKPVERDASGKNKQIQNSDLFNSVQDYKFGQIIQNEERLFFKVQKGGKLTAFSPGFDAKTGKKIYHESKLNLSQIRSMTEMQIIGQKLFFEKRQHSKKFQSQLQLLKSENITLKQNIKQIELKNTALSNELHQTKQNFSTLKVQQNKTAQQLKQTKQQMKKLNDELTKKTKEINDELSKKVKELTDAANKNKQTLTKDIEKAQQTINGKIDGVDNKLLKEFNSFANKYNLFNLAQPFLGKFRVCLNQLEYNGQNGAWTHFMFNQKIIHNTPYTFKIKILKTSSRNIMIGITDYTKQKDQRSSYSSNQAACYYGSNGHKYGQGAVEGTGFVQGETVEVFVNLAAKTIKWSVGGAQRAISVLDFLADQTRVFRPFVDMYNTADIVQWCFQ